MHEGAVDRPRAAGSGTARLLDHAAKTPHDRARSRLRAGANVFTVLFPESSEGTEFALTARSLRRHEPRSPRPATRPTAPALRVSHPLRSSGSECSAEPRRTAPARPKSAGIWRLGDLRGGPCRGGAQISLARAHGRRPRRAVSANAVKSIQPGKRTVKPFAPARRGERA